MSIPEIAPPITSISVHKGAMFNDSLPNKAAKIRELLRSKVWRHYVQRREFRR